MKDKNNHCYVYIHRRLDTNEVFYVGIGKTLLFKRAYTKHNRNKFWHNIVKKVNYAVDIIYKDISWEQACKYEINLITMYGRKDLKKGSLVNMTDGGEGNRNWTLERKQKHIQAISGQNHYLFNNPMSKETKTLMSISQKQYSLRNGNNFKGKFHTEESKTKMSEAQLRGKSHRAKKVIDLSTGIVYDCIKSAADATGINSHYLSQKLRGLYENKTTFRLLESL